MFPSYKRFMTPQSTTSSFHSAKSTNSWSLNPACPMVPLHSGYPNARHVVKTHDLPGAGGQPLLKPGPLAMETDGLAMLGFCQTMVS